MSGIIKLHDRPREGDADGSHEPVDPLLSNPGAMDQIAQRSAGLHAELRRMLDEDEI